MARLHEYQGKTLLRDAGVMVPDGEVAHNSDKARAIAQQLNARVVMKIQAWTTGRAAIGGVVFANSPHEAQAKSSDLFVMSVGNFPVSEVLVEKAIKIKHEIFVSLTIDDAARSPLLLLDAHGGSGIEERSAGIAKIPVDVEDGIDETLVREELLNSPINVNHHTAIVEAINKIIALATRIEARSFEVNPLVVTEAGHPAEIVAADCRVTIDDYAVFRQPELGIQIARELDHPPTDLERLAYDIEEADHRGTFYFAQLNAQPLAAKRSQMRIGFHGAGGGGSMMSMDAATNAGFELANFCDTSGNPSAAKVYRAARIILSQHDLVGYFGSGSGVASQEQFWSAYGLAKAFNEVNLSIPAVIRLGGNAEDRAVEILEDACQNLPGIVEGYKKDDTPQFCAERFAELVSNAQSAEPLAENSRFSSVQSENLPDYVNLSTAYSFPITGGRVWIDHDNCDAETTQFIIDHSYHILKLDAETNKPVLALSEDEVAGKDSEMIACEIECLRAGKPVVFVELRLGG